MFYERIEFLYQTVAQANHSIPWHVRASIILLVEFVVTERRLLAQPSLKLTRLARRKHRLADYVEKANKECEKQLQLEIKPIAAFLSFILRKFREHGSHCQPIFQSGRL